MLEKIDSSIKNFKSFGLLHFAIGGSESTFETDILPILLERKRLILEGLRDLKSDERIESLKKLIEEKADESVQLEFEKRINELNAELKDWKKKADEVEVEKNKAQLEKQSEQLVKISTELYDRKIRFWRSLIERESAATLIGSVLLILIASFLIGYAIVKENETSLNALSNAFLLILGYFFGQQASGRKSN